MYCRKCGAKKRHKLICPKCKTPSDMKLPDNLEYVYCSKCGHKMHKEEKVCLVCAIKTKSKQKGQIVAKSILNEKGVVKMDIKETKKEEINLKQKLSFKKIIIFVVAAILLIGSVSYIFRKDSIKIDSLNSYNISIYKANYKQEDDGKIVFTGLKLKESFQIAKTQMFELKYRSTEKKDAKTGETWQDERYVYSGISGKYEIVNHKKIQVLPNADSTIIMKERELKDISVYYEGREISYYLSHDMRNDYELYWKDTYNEDFTISGEQVSELLKYATKSVEISLYTTPNFKGEPFATGNFYYSSYSGFSGSLTFELIETTKVYMDVRSI